MLYNNNDYNALLGARNSQVGGWCGEGLFKVGGLTR